MIIGAQVRGGTKRLKGMKIERSCFEVQKSKREIVISRWHRYYHTWSTVSSSRQSRNYVNILARARVRIHCVYIHRYRIESRLASTKILIGFGPLISS